MIVVINYMSKRELNMRAKYLGFVLQKATSCHAASVHRGSRGAADHNMLVAKTMIKVSVLTISIGDPNRHL